MQAAFNMPMLIEQQAEKMPAAISPSLMRLGNCFKVMLAAKKVRVCTISATAPQIAQSNRDSELVMALANGQAKPINAPAKAMAAAGLLARIKANSSCGVIKV